MSMFEELQVINLQRKPRGSSECNLTFASFKQIEVGFQRNVGVRKAVASGVFQCTRVCDCLEFTVCVHSARVSVCVCVCVRVCVSRVCVCVCHGCVKCVCVCVKSVCVCVLWVCRVCVKSVCVSWVCQVCD